VTKTAAAEAFAAALGVPTLEIVYPVTPIPRPAGKPFFNTSDRALSNLCLRAVAGDKKAHARLAKIRTWDRWRGFRDAVEHWTKFYRSGETLTGPVMTIMEFHLPRRAKIDPAENVVTKPDLKNLIWAFEDALNPRYRMVAGVRTKVWDGLWKDDSQVDTLGLRFYSETDNGRIEFRLWDLSV
jgi:Holliday junction resolvase RusA-like endonuclease